MALYYDAVNVLSGHSEQGSLKSRIYSNTSSLKSKPAQVYALVTECAKYDVFFKEVIENAGLLNQEPKLSPLLSLLLVHDHFFSKGGIAASSTHVLRQSIERHKARLQAEFTKARLRRKCVSVDALKQKLASEKPRGLSARQQPRWVRINRLKATAENVLDDTFASYEAVSNISSVVQAEPNSRLILRDPNIPDLLALPPGTDLTRTDAYETGKIILQDKASCFPAYLLLGSTTSAGPSNAITEVGDMIDACAAPGNKTTHLASLLASTQSGPLSDELKIFACERDPARSQVLQSMVSKAGATNVQVIAKQDFLALDSTNARFRNVTHLLLDPSCSGSGIVGREDIPSLTLPDAPARPFTSQGQPQTQNQKDSSKNKKRKRTHPPPSTTSSGSGSITHNPTNLTPNDPISTAEEESPTPPQPLNTTRLTKLSHLQTLILQHAFSFPAARRVVYSTCSVHTLENESVVARALASSIARQRGWRLLRRDEQVSGLVGWEYRGVRDADGDGVRDGEGFSVGSGQRGEGRGLTDGEIDACIRCHAGGEDGTMGFFVCGFVRDGVGTEGVGSGGAGTRADTGAVTRTRTRADDGDGDDLEKQSQQQQPQLWKHENTTKKEQEREDEWSGFSD